MLRNADATNVWSASERDSDALSAQTVLASSSPQTMHTVATTKKATRRRLISRTLQAGRSSRADAPFVVYPETNDMITQYCRPCPGPIIAKAISGSSIQSSGQ